MINGLAPHLDVVTIGSKTFGKPVGSHSFAFCDKILQPMMFQLFNATGEGDYFDGLGADCSAFDDFNTALGNPAEDSLAEALFYLEHGTCARGMAARAQLSRSERHVVQSVMPELIRLHPLNLGSQ